MQVICECKWQSLEGFLHREASVALEANSILGANQEKGAVEG